MIDFSVFSANPPSLDRLPLKRYRVDLSLDRLVCGVDGIHVDVRISSQVYNALRHAVTVSMVKHSRTEGLFDVGQRDRRENEKLALRKVCASVLLQGIHRAKAASEVQIDFLGQVALAKLFLDEIRNEYRRLMSRLETLIRTRELSRNCDQLEWLKMKEKLAEIKHRRDRIVRKAGEELFQVLADVQAKDLRRIRESNFPSESIPPDDLFVNPTLHAEDVADDFLLVDSYVLLSQRSDEPDNYSNVKSILWGLFGETDLGGGDGVRPSAGDREAVDAPAAAGRALDSWLMETENVDTMFNCFQTRTQYQEAKKCKKPKAVLLELRTRMKIQERMLRLLYRKFNRYGLLVPIVAAYETRGVYRGYCPPLRPAQIREYLVRPESRKSIARELRRRKADSGDLAPLRKTLRRIRGCSGRERKEHLLKYLRDFLRYHRDRENGRLLRQAMEAVNLVTDDKIVLLSRNNRLLYEYPLPEERVNEEKPIIHHVILKADIRGSMDITHTMSNRGLNPASYFSLNFFDPISDILGEYGASKVFIEGDAIILSIFENEDAAQGGYGVARACGLAVSMLHIVHQYNLKNRQHDLPILELGIGICYLPGPPAFLFDGDSRIMISHAINLADRLSSCDKRLRRRFKNPNPTFNLYLFRGAREEDVGTTADDLSLRYNVNGIELDPAGFAKLRREINLKRFEYPAENGDRVTLYAGTVPTLIGSYQRLVIREAPVMKIEPESMELIGPASEKYYEVCTHPAVYGFIDAHP